MIRMRTYGTYVSWVILFLSSFVLLTRYAHAQAEDSEDTLEKMKQGLLSSFQAPFSEMIPPEEAPLFDQLTHGFSGDFAFNFPLRNRTFRLSSGKKSQGERSQSLTVSTSLRYNPMSYWFVKTTFLYYFDKKAKAPWDSEFTYVFGYEDWHPYTLSLVYSNYDGNHFSPDRSKGEKFTRIEQGTISLGWKYQLPRPLEELFIVHPSGSLRAQFNYNVVPQYRDIHYALPRHWKQSFSCNLRYIVYKSLYGSITFFGYPERAQQQPWDPDFTYTFGVSDNSFGNLSVQYNNYSGNRFPWKNSRPDNGNFFKGGVSISWNWNW